MKAIILTQDKIAWVDDEDYGWLSTWTWQAWKGAGKRKPRWYAVRYELIGGKYKAIWMHRQILGLPRGRFPEIDHINHDGLDNRRCNIRIVNHQENLFNNGQAKGFSWNRRTHKFQAAIGLNENRIYLGSYDTPWEARAVYLKAKAKYHKINGYPV
jgi:hypothetical protein